MTQDGTSRKTHIIAVGNQKGGVGKTTNAVHLAAALAEKGRKCLICDLDMNHGATQHFGIPADAFLGTFEVLTGTEQPVDVILTGDETEDEISLPKNIHLLPSRRKLETIDSVLREGNKFINPADVLLKPLASLRGVYDYIFLDTAPNATIPTVAAYKAAEWFILTAIPDPFAINGLGDALSDIQQVQQEGNPGLRLLGVILSGVDKRTTLANQLTQYVNDAFSPEEGRSMKFDTLIGRSTVIPRAQETGKTLFQTAPTHKVTDQYRSLATEVEERIHSFTAESHQLEVATAEVVHG